MKLTPEQAAKMREANLGNLVKKLKAGKTLTAAEGKLIDDASTNDDGEKVALCTLSKVCDLFSIDRKTVSNWRRDGRNGVPAKVGNKEDLTAWRKFFAANPEAGFRDGKPRKDRESLLCQKLEVDIELKEINLRAAKKLFLSRQEVEDRDIRIGSVVAAGLRALENELPQIALGLPLERSRPLIKTRIREVQGMMSDEFGAYWKDNPETE